MSRRWTDADRKAAQAAMDNASAAVKKWVDHQMDFILVSGQDMRASQQIMIDAMLFHLGHEMADRWAEAIGLAVISGTIDTGHLPRYSPPRR